LIVSSFGIDPLADEMKMHSTSSANNESTKSAAKEDVGTAE